MNKIKKQIAIYESLTNRIKPVGLFKFYLFVIGVLVLLFSCTKKSFDSQAKFMAYLQDSNNGYFQEKMVDGVYYSLLYKPTDLLVYQELQSDAKIDIKKTRKKYKKYLYFTLSISKNGQELLNSARESRSKFGAMVGQLAFDMDKKVHLYSQKKDTLEMLDYIYPRTYGLTPISRMLFVFPRDTKILNYDYLNFTIEDIGFETGEVKFKIPTKKILKEPNLTL